MDRENTLRLLFPEVDPRLIKAIVLDGDDMDSAVDFLIKEGIQSDKLKPDKILRLASNYFRVDGAFIMHGAKIHHTKLDQDEHYLNDLSCDKHEESIVWKGGLVPCRLADQKVVHANERQGLDDFYESDSQPEDAVIQGNERIEWWAATWPKSTGLQEDDALDDSSSSLVNTEAGSLLWNDIELCKSLQQDCLRRPCAGADLSSSVSTQSSMPDKEKESSWANVDGFREFQKGRKHLVGLDLPLSQETLEVFPPMAVGADMSEGGILVSSSDNSYPQSVKGGVKDEDNKISSCQSVNLKRDCAIQEIISESPQHIIDTEDLDELVFEAKCHKENMRKGMEEIYLLRQKAEQEELVARQVKAEAAHGGFKILSKVEKLQQQLSRERMEYDMRAAEVYGERSVLSMEARELRSRLLKTQAEQARALSLLDSVRCTLEARLQKASEEKDFAVMEAKLQEESAKELLAHEEDSVRTLAENFKAIEAEAETCRRLREFLIERGNAVDSLQGEMAVLCEDVLTFKKQVDEGLPLTGSRALSWSHMSHLTEQFMSTSLSSDMLKDCRSSRSLPLESSDFLRSTCSTSIFIQSLSDTSGLQMSAGPIDCPLQSQYFSPNMNPIDTLDTAQKKGMNGQEAVGSRIAGLITLAHCDSGQMERQQGYDLTPANGVVPVFEEERML